MIRASAGSGKTWQLAMRYIGLLVLGVRPEKIIALTFTKKAAGEFAERILMRLAQAASSKAEALSLAADLQGVILGDGDEAGLVEGSVSLPVLDQAFFQRLLQDLTSTLDRLSLSTLDSFFVKLLKNFALELGISGFEMIDEETLKRQKMQTLQQIFQNKLSERQKGAFIAAYQSSTAGKDELRLYKTLDDFLTKYHKLLGDYPDLRQWGNRQQLWPDDSWSLPEGGNYIEKAERVRALMQQPGAYNITRKNFDQTIYKLCDWVEEREGAAGTSMKGAPSWFGKTLRFLDSFRFGKSDPDNTHHNVIVQFSPALSIALYEMVGAVVADEIEVKLEQTQGVGLLAYSFEQAYSQGVRSSGKLGFADIPLVLNGGDQRFFDKVSRELVDYRFDERFDHWMLDEFQDTSREQWRTIAGLVDEVIATKQEGRSLFVVGDQKQSIYQWRGGDPRLFEDILSTYNVHPDQSTLHEKPLDRSFRSSPDVLQLVNEVFDKKSLLSFPAASIEAWQFQKHTAARSDLKGQSLVLEVASEEKFDWVGKIIEKLDVRRRGISCAVLLRKNDQIKQLVAYLREHYPELPITAEDKTQAAEDNPVTSVLMDWFRYLAYPKDSLALAHVEMSPLGAVVFENNTISDWYRWTQQLAHEGLSACLDHWISKLRERVSFSAFTESRLNGLLHLAAQFEQSGEYDLELWLQTMEDWQLREVTRGGVVQIMTAHRSKGLGFDAVIMPELGGDAFTNLNKLGRSGILKIEERGLLRPVGKDLLQAEPTLNKAKEVWEADASYEGFCVLYVMMTRAKQANYCLVSPRNKTERLNMEDWLLRVTGQEGKELRLGDLSAKELYHAGGWGWIDEHAAREESEPEQGGAKIQLLSTEDSMTAMQRQRLTVSQHGQQSAAAIANRLRNYRQMKFGDAVHACFESIHWWQGNLDWEGDELVKKIVTECMASPSIVPYFREAELVEPYREQSVEGIVDGVWVSGVIDRLLLKKDEQGAVEGVVIVDFKTDAVDSVGELVDKYQEQLHGYRDLMLQSYGLELKQVYCVIISTRLRQSILLDRSATSV